MIMVFFLLLEELEIADMDMKLKLECQFHLFNNLGKLDLFFHKGPCKEK